MIARTFRGSSSLVTRTETPFRRSVMNRHDVHHAAKIADVARAYSREDSGRNSTTAGTNSVSVDVTDVNRTYPSEEKIRNHCRGVIAGGGARRPRGNPLTTRSLRLARLLKDTAAYSDETRQLSCRDPSAVVSASHASPHRANARDGVGHPRTRSRRVASRLPRRDRAALARRASAPAPLVPTRTTPRPRPAGRLPPEALHREPGCPRPVPSDAAASRAGERRVRDAPREGVAGTVLASRELVPGTTRRATGGARRRHRGVTTSAYGARREDREGPLLARSTPSVGEPRGLPRRLQRVPGEVAAATRARGRRRAPDLEKACGPGAISTSARRAPSSARTP